MTKKLAIDLDELIFHSTWSDSMEIGPVSFFDTDTGALVSVEREVWNAVAVDEEEDLSDFDPDQVEDARRGYETGSSLVDLPELESDESFRFMADFTENSVTGAVQSKLIRALEGQRPFRRFKDALTEFPEVREQWFAYEAERQREWILRWLEGLDIMPVVPEKFTGKPSGA